MTQPLRARDTLAPMRTDSGQATDPRASRRTAPRRGRFARVMRGLMGALFGLVLLVGVVGAAGGWMAWKHFANGLPDVDGLRNYQPPVMSRVYAGDARLLADLATERRIFVPFSAMPEMVTRAFVSAEDQNFWTHPGVDPLAIARAAAFDVMHMGQGRRPIGASTITQQVAKNMLLDSQLSVSRKVKEAILATRIEQVLTKQRILELYLNEIYLGLGSYGVAAAAQAYFNKPLDQLTLAETAFLAALPKAPNNYNPFKFPEAAKARRDWVLDRLAEDHAITTAQASAAKAEPIVPSEFRRPAPVPGADWFTEEVRRQLITRFGQDATTQGGLMVRTSLDPVLQAAADRSLRDGLMAYDRKLGGWRGAVTHLEGGEKEWQAALAQVARPSGMLPSWRLAVVLGTGETEARLGWLTGDANAPSQPRTGTLILQDVAWARPVRDGKPGAPPRRMTDVVQTGDVVMIEPPAQAGGSAPGAQAQTMPAQTVPGQTMQARGVRAVALPAPAFRPVLRQIPVVQGAIVSLDPNTGRVLAMVGGWSYEQSQFNRATQAQRQPGSSFKPMVYLTALEKGISPSQRFLDAPIVVDTPEGRWRPGNFEGTFGGPTPLRVALERSLNLVTLRVAQQVGMDAVADTAIAFHMNDGMPRVLPAALGAVVTTVLREAGAYASLAAGGREVVPTLIDSVQDPDGHVVWRAGARSCEHCENGGSTPPQLQDERKQIADPQSVFQLVTMMQGVVQRGTGVAAGKGLNRPIAGKTGTSQDFVDAWFSGFTPNLVTTVWIGFDSPTSLGASETGGTLAAPVWHDFMAEALKNQPVLNFPMPPGLTMAQWDTGSGTSTDAFKPDQVPGASGPVFGSFVSAPANDPGTATQANAPGTVHGGVDSSLGGLY